MQDDMDMGHFRSFATLAATGAGAMLRKGFEGGNAAFERKADGSLRTEFDTLAESKIIEMIRSRFPDHAIFAEESGGEIGDGFTWLIDPLDGTSNFAMKNPLFSVAISLAYAREIVLAVVFCPMLNEFYRAEKDDGAYLNGKGIHVSDTRKLKDATVGFNKGRGEAAFLRYHWAVGKLGGKVRTLRTLGSSAYEACQVATGRMEGYVNVQVSPWDSLGPAFIVEQAGGKATNFTGDHFSLNDKDFLLTNGHIQSEVLDAIGAMKQ